MYANVSGTLNAAIGSDALGSNTMGSYNTASGAEALLLNDAGSYNVASGYQALSDNLGSYNTGVGAQALWANSGGEFNVGIGPSTNRFNTAGSMNTIVGYEAGRGSSIHSKSGNVFLGFRAGYKETGNNKLYIHNDSTGLPLIYGEFDNDLLRTHGNLQVYHLNDSTGGGLRIKNVSAADYWRLYVSSTGGDLKLFNTSAGASVGHFDLTTGAYSGTSDARLKKNIEALDPVLWKITLLRPMYYQYIWQPQSDRRSVGFLAQDVAKVFPDAVSYDPDEDQYSINYDVFGVVAIKAIQELNVRLQSLEDRLHAQQEIIESQQSRIDDLRTRDTNSKSPGF
jgi:hypothetical protein